MIYINDLANSSNLFNYALFADDSTFYASHSNLHYLVTCINQEIVNVKNWVLSNKLTLNIKKTNYIIFARIRKTIPPVPTIKIGNETLKRVNQTVFLGVTIHKHLSWQCHVHNLVQKINKQCGILYLTRSKLNPVNLKLIYQSLIHPLITYCSLAWGGISNDQLKSINTAHKRVIRTIANLRKYDHTNQTFKDLGILKFYDILKLRYATFVYKSLQNQNDHNFRHRENQNYDLRNASILNPPFMRSCQSQTSALYQSVQVWNGIPDSIKSKPTIASFKRAYKVYTLSRY